MSDESYKEELEKYRVEVVKLRDEKMKLEIDNRELNRKLSDMRNLLWKIKILLK